MPKNIYIQLYSPKYNVVVVVKHEKLS